MSDLSFNEGIYRDGPLPVWDKMTWWPQFYEHIIKSTKHQTGQKIIKLVKIIVNNRYSFLFTKTSVGIILGGS